MLLNQWITEEIKEEIKTYLKTKEKHNDPKSRGPSKRSSKTEVYSNSLKKKSQQTKAQEQMASQVNSTKHLEKS